MQAPPKPKRRWFQYSMRSLLLLTTLLAVWLAVQVNRARQRKRAIEAITGQTMHTAVQRGSHTLLPFASGNST